MSGIINNPQFITIVIKVHDGEQIELGSEIEVQGQNVICQTINWGTNSCLKADALEQRLQVALEVLHNAGHGYMDYYNEMLAELRDEGDLFELEED